MACVDTENSLLKARGKPLITADRYREIFQFPVINYYLACGFTFEDETYEAVSDEYTAGYIDRSRGCGLFHDAEKALDTLRGAGLNQALLTASSETLLRAQMKPFGIAHYFSAIIAQDNVLARGKLESGIRFMRERGIDPDKTVLIGDTEHDCEVARELGASALLVPRGHHTAERLQAAHEACGGGGGIVPTLTDAAEWITARV
jgi:phosphoglycolate phosphatase